MAGGEVERLRIVTYLVPSLPQALFAALAAAVEAGTGVATELVMESRWSGPPLDVSNPFLTGDADVGFMCAPAYLWLRHRSPAAVEPLPGPVFADRRAAGRPVYFSEVVVAAGSPITSMEQLSGASWAYNDPLSLSGYFAVLLAEADAVTSLGEGVCSGSHLASMEWVASGKVTTAAIDANVLARAPIEVRSGLRTVASLGPHPVQPAAIRTDLPRRIIDAVAAALAGAGSDPDTAALLRAHGVVGLMLPDEQEMGRQARRLHDLGVLSMRVGSR